MPWERDVMRHRPIRHLSLLAALLLLAAPVSAQDTVNWETPHVSPLGMTPDGALLLVVNTPDSRLEVFDLTGPALVRLPDVPVGLDPVSVRARTNSEAWVVNHVSDSVSIVDLPTGRVRATLLTDDEPCDVVFAGSPQRAFVSCSQANTVLVFDPADLSASPTRIVIDAEEPRAMAVSPSGDSVYVAIFESGNGSTILGGGSVANFSFPPNVATDPAGPYGGTNPPPNDGGSFDPPQNPANPPPPEVGMIVKKDGNGQWMDDNGGNWTSLVSGPMAAKSGRIVGWDLPDRDVAVIDTASLAVSYLHRLMNINMAMSVRASDGRLTVVGTEATNEIRFEPVIRGTFTRVNVALVNAGNDTASVVDLNAHLSYASSAVPQATRDIALGDPRGIVWNVAGTRAYVTGMGSNNVVVIDAAGTRAGLAPTIEVGEGPTGVVLDEARNRVYVLNKFEGSVSVLDTITEVETARVSLFDPSPLAITLGRKHLYDTHKNSGLGQLACGSCHVDARMDRLAWDLGDPAGDMRSVAGNNLGANIPGLAGGFEDFHPMKGPMLTQTLQDIIGKEPHHWRGDRTGLEDFNGAFLGLQGDDANLTDAEMQEFEDFLATIHFPPNPFRNFDNSLPTNLPLPGHLTTGRFGPAGLPMPNGNAVNGLSQYRPPNLLDAQAVACVTCHTLPIGIGTDYQAAPPFFITLMPIPPGPMGERHHALVSVDGSTNVSMKIPQLRNLYERTGFNALQSSNRNGFGFLHDGSIDSIERFITEPIFSVTSEQQVADLTAFMLAFSGSDLPAGSTSTPQLEPPGTASQDSHAAVGEQTTLVSMADAAPVQLVLIDSMLTLADTGKVGVVVKGSQGGLMRGYVYTGGSSFQSDRQTEAPSKVALLASAAAGSELTFTVVPDGTQTRIGIDRDRDGVLDRDELDACADPGDPDSVPGNWTDHANGLAGTHGVPTLDGCGTLVAGDPVTLTLTGALENSITHLVIGSSIINLPFKGGIMVPSVDVLVSGIPTGPSGTVVLSGPMAPGLPSGFTLVFQYWTADPAGPVGFSASNGLGGTTP
jgi:YVTN family beta-propeller protein